MRIYLMTLYTYVKEDVSFDLCYNGYYTSLSLDWYNALSTRSSDFLYVFLKIFVELKDIFRTKINK